MHVTAAEACAVPVDRAVAAMTAYDAWEAAIGRRAPSMERVTEGPIREGTAWRTTLSLLGAERHIESALRSVERSGDGGVVLRFDGTAQGVRADVLSRAVPLGPDRCRIEVEVEMTGESLPGKLLLKGLSVARGPVEDRLARGLRRFARNVEAGTVGPGDGVI
ncbi:hypothetical protein JQC91_13735 [Jannaschia sp. Os4]|uniref:hypothetical protein n=1 Tax=Jannaschia sp. Os4 TaxID=2807617 RepID=UPI00193A4A44|nr:hypothetical protein [Jannaschia sp. Os4]MBM2577365.1 hypothetical protein [Jannaschia sp. Os4]